ncbi:hypothetical protein JXB12_08570 [candidate division KSB1 bacterium]|nr:hypothetical protein [candidate division KSB1 bacterium]
MIKTFTLNDIKKIATGLKTDWFFENETYRLTIHNAKTKSDLNIEIHPWIVLGDHQGILITVRTENFQLQLHACHDYIISKLLCEVLFVAEHNGRINGLILDQDGNCSFYANVDRSLLSGNYSKYHPDVILSSIALSPSERILAD